MLERGKRQGWRDGSVVKVEVDLAWVVGDRTHIRVALPFPVKPLWKLPYRLAHRLVS